jgi:hypothetical protein
LISLNLDDDDNMFLPGLLNGNTLPVSSPQSANNTNSTNMNTTIAENPSAQTVEIAVGASLGALLLVSIATIIWMWSKMRSLSKELETAKSVTTSYTQSSPEYHHVEVKNPLPAHRLELPTGPPDRPYFEVA